MPNKAKPENCCKSCVSSGRLLGRSKCRECRHTYARRYRQRWIIINRERAREYKKLYVNENRLRINANNREWRRRNPDKVRAIRQRWICANKAYYRLQRRRYQSSPDVLKRRALAWRKYYRANASNPVWRKKRYDSYWTKVYGPYSEAAKTLRWLDNLLAKKGATNEKNKDGKNGAVKQPKPKTSLVGSRSKGAASRGFRRRRKGCGRNLSRAY